MSTSEKPPDPTPAKGKSLLDGLKAAVGGQQALEIVYLGGIVLAMQDLAKRPCVCSATTTQACASCRARGFFRAKPRTP